MADLKLHDMDWQDFRNWDNGRIMETYISSPEIDKQNDLIPTEAMKNAMDFYMKYGIYSYKHDEIPIGRPLGYCIKDGKVKIKVGIYDKLPMHNKVWKEIQEHGKKGTSSIRGEAMEKKTVCEEGTCHNLINELGLWSVSWVGDNPANKDAVVSFVSMAKTDNGDDPLIKQLKLVHNMLVEKYNGIVTGTMSSAGTMVPDDEEEEEDDEVEEEETEEEAEEVVDEMEEAAEDGLVPEEAGVTEVSEGEEAETVTQEAEESTVATMSSTPPSEEAIVYDIPDDLNIDFINFDYSGFEKLKEMEEGLAALGPLMNMADSLDDLNLEGAGTITLEDGTKIRPGTPEYDEYMGSLPPISDIEEIIEAGKEQVDILGGYSFTPGLQAEGESDEDYAARMAIAQEQEEKDKAAREAFLEPSYDMEAYQRDLDMYEEVLNQWKQDSEEWYQTTENYYGTKITVWKNRRTGATSLGDPRGKEPEPPKLEDYRKETDSTTERQPTVDEIAAETTEVELTEEQEQQLKEAMEEGTLLEDMKPAEEETAEEETTELETDEEPPEFPEYTKEEFEDLLAAGELKLTPGSFYDYNIGIIIGEDGKIYNTSMQEVQIQDAWPFFYDGLEYMYDGSGMFYDASLGMMYDASSDIYYWTDPNNPYGGVVPYQGQDIRNYYSGQGYAQQAVGARDVYGAGYTQPMPGMGGGGGAALEEEPVEEVPEEAEATIEERDGLFCVIDAEGKEVKCYKTKKGAENRLNKLLGE